MDRKKSDKVEWMYAGAMGAGNRDDYLLGKAVDKTILLKGNKNEEDTMTSVRVSVRDSLFFSAR